MLLLVSTAPLAGATHWTLHYGPLDVTAGWTLEDDEEVFRAPGHYLDGRRNHVVLPGTAMGDGSLFLDARVGNEAILFDMYVAAFAGDILGRPNLLLPPTHHASAWYGLWDDREKDGFIHDVHDSLADVQDEFVWRGRSSGHPVAISYFIGSRAMFGFHGLAPADDHVTPRTMIDRTDSATQEWVDDSLPARLSLDGGLLATYPMLTLAGAPVSAGHPVGFDLDAPGALYDVDVYEALTPDVELLWRAALGEVAAAKAVADGEVAKVTSLVRNTLPIVNGLTAQVAAVANELTEDGLNVFRAITPFDPREPNTVWDDYEGRAFHGGVGDILGTGNTYPEYEAGYRFWFDAYARMIPCGRVHVTTPVGVGISDGACSTVAYDPVGKRLEKERSAGTMLVLQAYAALWHDMNRDGRVGIVCDPKDPDQWDGEANTCRERVVSPGDAHRYSAAEPPVAVCAISSVPDGSAEIRPLEGGWGGAILVRDYREPNRGIPPSAEILLDSSVVTLRFASECDNNHRTISTRDAIFFPPGTPVGALWIETRAQIEGYQDARLEINLGRESVLDIDILRGTL